MNEPIKAGDVCEVVSALGHELGFLMPEDGDYPNEVNCGFYREGGCSDRADPPPPAPPPPPPPAPPRGGRPRPLS